MAASLTHKTILEAQLAAREAVETSLLSRVRTLALAEPVF